MVFGISAQEDGEIIVPVEQSMPGPVTLEPGETCEEPTDDDSEPDPEPCVGCTGCDFGWTREQGAQHSTNVTLSWRQPGTCVADSDGCWPDTPCTGTANVSVPIFPGETMYDSRTGRCVRNGGAQIMHKTFRYTFSGDCGSYGTVSYYFHDGTNCNQMGERNDWARVVFYCNYCS